MADFLSRFKGKTSSISRDGSIRENEKGSLPIQRRAKSGGIKYISNDEITNLYKKPIIDSIS